MEFIRQTIPDVILVQPKIHGDDRGYFLETFRQDLFEKFVGQKIKFIQDNESKSSKGVLRGLHYQLTPYAQAKLVRVIEGSVLDVAVDIRPSSPTFGKYVAVKLTSQNKQQLFIPQGFAHGFVVLSQSAIFSYKVDNYYNPAQEQGIAYNDPQLAIDWQLPKQQLQLSEKGRGFPDFNSISH
ncbi:dTDP-4-dehydrorhamnose 3,5-epimerase (EC 5.1.3.13) [uncultured Gammaproteobacteria bacterium]|jgi:dTDP-4-dehydrorhamnose 3,5-epimerase|uniref:dTDP-4-dehydrorhamnose 3,5-epimerase n=2 Tax=sulfur-oxidizing symbionts TaxID=32036 RepID=A0A1H6JXJ3_9GAMM|nr:MULTISPECIES: dTDP-4-dehydrorhamnose 3,5-epimerase [sulfur-oxidizing symbionts]CAC5861528.1 dTDP-4-dehydrorhamnose 3,5-epimerase (EC 5.1.3.13) [uncultured Gammaproteobacteria bacterium]CAB5502821.1 dTDP-4-dehydrorhamnose 3,5-epimerase (EC [Bathymodiolus thermophilus thioautotrophic gill symbiont]CAC9476644.1 dTDP-4-dehydrorhamnose 3,5-epimerase (EC 5.1.3.13) [uncultured Gammaproteobacteria bacterium]CAC9986119.1 dTDP-4-dehydrorhamnose 3,5-epimerase (EC 5.1.3.13) [uncultured Gammaproteobacter